MKYLINSMPFYFLLPIYTAITLLFIFFNVPEQFYSGLIMLFMIITLPVILSMLIIPLNMDLNHLYQRIKTKPQYRLVILLICSAIILFGPLDIYVNGFKLLNPSSYADFHGGGRYIRHITILCWMLIPVAFIYIRHPFIKLFFITYAIVFPIVIIDRNRLFLSFYSLFLCMVLTSSANKGDKKTIMKKLIFFALPLLCFLIFAVLGKFRSHNSFIIESSGTMLKEGFFPLKDSFKSLSPLLQQIVLYITTPIFNFLTIVSTDFVNQDFLLSQISPFSRDAFDAYPFVPIFVPRFNVGTEFYPFLLYGGLPMVAFAFLLMLFSFIGVYYLFKKYPNLFTFFIFIKISYSILFMGFAPQFFILLNLMFVILMMSLWFFSSLLVNAGNMKLVERQSVMVPRTS